MQSDKIPIDTNPIEQAIRTIAIYRQACWFKHNPQYVEDMCVIMSLYATLRDNGIENAQAWLMEYSTALYQHILEKLMTIDAMEGGCVNFEEFLKKRFRISKDPKDKAYIDNLLKGFDFEAWVQKVFTE